MESDVALFSTPDPTGVGTQTRLYGDNYQGDKGPKWNNKFNHDKDAKPCAAGQRRQVCEYGHRACSRQRGIECVVYGLSRLYSGDVNFYISKCKMAGWFYCKFTNPA